MSIKRTVRNALSITTTLLAATALAQQAKNTAGAAGELEEIVVTATRVATNLQSTPVAITAMNAQSLEERSVRGLQEVANFTPSFTVGGRGGQATNQGAIAIRGMGSDAPDSAPSVGIYIDEVYYPSVTGNLLGLFDIERIEVLRGPQGTLFGRNTIAGAVQYINNKPSTAGFSGVAEARIGSYDSHLLSAAVNLPLGGTWAARLSAQTSKDGGYINDRLNGVKRGEVQTDQARLQLRWQPTAALTVDLKGETVETKSNGRPVTVGGFKPAQAGAYLVAAGIVPGLPPPFVETRPFLPSYISAPGSYDNAGFNQPDNAKVKYHAGNAVISYDLTDSVRLKSISAYSETDAQVLLDFDASPLSILFSDRGAVRTNLFTQELQLSGNNLVDRLHWTAGVYYYNSTEKTKNQTRGLGNFLLPVNPATELKNDSKAVYGQATYDLTKRFSATAGLRYSTEEVTARYYNGAYPIARQKFTDTSPYVGLNGQVTEDALLYAKASKGFRAGGFHVEDGLPGGSLYFGPETAWTYEAGARLSFLERRLRINPTLFQTDWNNIQFVYITLPRGAPIAATQNAGDARLKGFELETQYALTRQWQLNAALSLLDAKYTRLAPAQPGSLPIVLQRSDPLARSPKSKYTVGGRYAHPFASGAEAAISVDYAWTAQQRSSVDGSQAIEMPSFGLLNARLQYVTPNKLFTFAVYGTNLTDKYYLMGGIDFQGSAGTVVQEVGRPREVGAAVKLSF